MSRITEAEIKNLKDVKEGESLTESLGKGRGAMVFRKVANTTTGYFRYWKGKQSIFIKLGTYKAPRIKAAGFTLEQLRAKALDMAAIRQQIAPQDLKEYLEDQEQARERATQERRRLEEIAATQGSLEDLCNSYLADMERKERKSVKVVHGALELYCLKPFPELAHTKAREITPEDIVAIIRRMMDQGITTTSNRLRSYLMAAFNYGMQADHNPRQMTEHGKRFNIDFNPVAAIPRQADYERVRDRRLNNAEIRDMWENIEKGKPEWSPVYGLLVRFCLACYGNRPEQLNDVKWTDIDFRRKTLRFIDSKGKNAIPRKRSIPLSPLALDLLEQARLISGEYQWPFSTSGKAPIRTDNVATFVRAYNQWRKKKAIEEEKPEPEIWTAKDLRTTATSLLTRLRVPKEQRYLLQSREDGSIESKHYDHDDRIPEKRDAAKTYDNYLKKIITGTVPAKLVDIGQYRQEKGG